MKVGATVKVFGKHVAKVTAMSSNGKRAHVASASYTGWTNVSNLTAAA